MYLLYNLIEVCPGAVEGIEHFEESQEWKRWIIGGESEFSALSQGLVERRESSCEGGREGGGREGGREGGRGRKKERGE